MRRVIFSVLILAALSTFCHAGVATSGSAHSLGFGAHYWRTVESVTEKGIKEDGVGYYVSYQYRPSSIIRLGVDVEAMPEKFAGADNNIYLPQAYILLGNDIYGGVGFGSYFYDWTLSGNAFYFLRGGISLDLLPLLEGDLYLQYRFENWARIDDVDEDISTDTITLGGALRLTF